jgi:hypothetical protein
MRRLSFIAASAAYVLNNLRRSWRYKMEEIMRKLLPPEVLKDWKKLNASSRRRFLLLASQGVLAISLFPSSVRADATYVKKTLLYVGTGAANNGVCTTNVLHMNDTTRQFGYTIDDYSAQPRDQFVEAFVGAATNNLDVVSRDANYNYGATNSIGFLALNAIVPGAQKLYVGIGPHQNGVVTPNQLHLNEATNFFGYALPL